MQQILKNITVTQTLAFLWGPPFSLTENAEVIVPTNSFCQIL